MEILNKSKRSGVITYRMITNLYYVRGMMMWHVQIILVVTITICRFAKLLFWKFFTNIHLTNQIIYKLHNFFAVTGIFENLSTLQIKTATRFCWTQMLRQTQSSSVHPQSHLCNASSTQDILFTDVASLRQINLQLLWQALAVQRSNDFHQYPTLRQTIFTGSERVKGGEGGE